uniref:non-specific serine/threonine protein kinase n=1 Tax=Neogobius melanostomus TaxID=47308 RepID=A0A8C6V5N5_9GOBI
IKTSRNNMETVGKFEFSRKDLIGHGAFAVVFKGRHKEKHDWEVAVKCINKKNLAKSQTLLGKEIKILKVSMCHPKNKEFFCMIPSLLKTIYCNGGDLADYLHSKGTLSEDTIRVFLQQITGAMRILQAKGIIHRDLKPQNILLSFPPGRKSYCYNTCIKIADFGFARHLQNNMMAATLCGSPMYMAPEVIMSQNYDAKADLWSIGTIVFQCLTGKAPFQASSPQELRLFYEKNTTLTPNIPRETSSHLRHLLLGLLQRNHKDRMDFGQSARSIHCYSSVFQKCNVLQYMLTYGCVFFFFFWSLQQSLAEGQQVRPKAPASPTKEATGFKDSSGGGGSSKNSSSCDTDDFVMVPAHFNSKCVSSRFIYFLFFHNFFAIAAYPSPTQVHNYQRMEQNLQCTRQDSSQRLVSNSSLGYGRQGPSPLYGQGVLPTNRRLSLGGTRPFQLSPQGNPQEIVTYCNFLFGPCPPGGAGGFAPSSGSPRQVTFTVGSPPTGSTPPQSSRQRKYSGSLTSVSSGGSLTSRYPLTGTYLDGFEAPPSPRLSFTDPITANMGGPVAFEAPELPEETLMEQEHTDTVQSLRFTLDFARCLVEVATARGSTAEHTDMAHPPPRRQHSLVADQISSLSREWSYAEQLVLYLKSADLLSTALRTAQEQVKEGKLYPSTTVKQVVKKLNELYKASVASCRSLSTRLEHFFSRKHRLMDQISTITAERLLFSHTVQMVQAAALDEMFHQGEASILRYHKALLLMEGLSMLLSEQEDILSVSKCKECIVRRLSALHSGLCV